MKILFAVAALATITEAYYLDEFVDDAPSRMGRRTKRFTIEDGKKVLEEQADYRSITKQCRKNVRKFDRYCHNLGKDRGGKRFSDYRDEDG